MAHVVVIAYKVYARRFLYKRLAATISSMKLLLLDSTPEVEHFAARLSANGEPELTVARDLECALQHLRAHPFDAVVLAMSFSGGAASVREILRSCQSGGTPVLLVLDELAEMAELGEQLIDGAVEDFVVRPMDPAVLQARLRFMRRRHSGMPPRAAMAALPDVMFRLKQDGTFIDYRAPSAPLGEGEQLTGANIVEVMPEQVARPMLGAIRDVLASNAPGFFEYDLPLPDGARSYEARIVPSGVDEALFIVHDVTERKRADAELRSVTAVKRAFTSRVISAQEAERQHLSRELHERIGQMLLVHRMDAEWLARKAEPGPLRDAAEDLCSSLDRTLEVVRNLAMDLRPPAIDDLGIGSALETLVANIARRSGIPSEIEIDPQEGDIPAEVSVAVYRIAQEALTNAVRHSQCQSIMVYLILDERNLELRVVDDGIGFDPGKEEGSSWLGLVGMRERAELVGGRVTIESRANEGTSVKVMVPNVLAPTPD